jgi:hypothetical protein
VQQFSGGWAIPMKILQISLPQGVANIIANFHAVLYIAWWQATEVRFVCSNIEKFPTWISSTPPALIKATTPEARSNSHTTRK